MLELEAIEAEQRKLQKEANNLKKKQQAIQRAREAEEDANDSCKWSISAIDQGLDEQKDDSTPR